MLLARTLPRIRAAAAAALLATLATMVAGRPARAQGGTTVRVNGKDSVAFIVPRQSAGQATLLTRDRKVALVLNDSAVVMQLTDMGMDHLFDADTATRGIGEAIFARMLRAGMTELLDHGVGYRLSALRRAYADGGRLVLEDSGGHHVFEDTELNGHHPLRELSPAEAERFAGRVQRAIEAARGGASRRPM
jgi:hypothetical protein